MAKKKIAGSPASSAAAPRPPRRASAKPAAAPVGVAAVSAVEPTDTADDEKRRPGRAPKHEEIAEAAYHRYLERGGNGGSDFDDWVEAERELRSRSRKTNPR